MAELPFVTYAQNSEDVLLWRALKHVEKGFYIDVGAQDPINDSVTKAFYERGWHGINIEPVERWYQRLTLDRPHDVNLRVAVSNSPGTMKLFEVEESGLSTADENLARRHAASGFVLREQIVDCMTLDMICADHGVETVHFLKIDCEGAEKATLEGISLTDVRPWIVLLEATEPNSTVPTWQAWEYLLTERGYIYVFFDGLNRYYLAVEHEDLASAFTAPANILDGARRIAEVNAERRVDQLRTTIDELSSAAVNAVLRAERDGLRAERDGLVVERDGLRAERDGLVAERDGLVAERDGLVAERDRLTSERNHTQAHLSALLGSHSWRITRPLRAISLLLRRLFRNSSVVDPPEFQTRQTDISQLEPKSTTSRSRVEGQPMTPDQVVSLVREEISRR
ncbi:MAG TPA: FkbM family methyltransferase [Rhodanobacteraceae bacterium]